MKDKKNHVRKLLKNKALSLKQMQRISGLTEDELSEIIKDIKSE
jgi:hypothetical protein